MRTVIIVQARMGSTRLPGKVLASALGRPLLFYLLERLRRCRQAEGIVVATSTNPRDQQIVDFCKSEKIPYFRGSENDLLERYWLAAKQEGADIIVRISADCPLIDPVLVDQLIALYRNSYPDYDYVSNTLSRTYPRGMDAEVFSFESLEETLRYATLPYQREHVTPYIYEHADRFKLGSATAAKDNSHYRLTVDTTEDLALVTKIIEKLYPVKPQFTVQELIDLLDANPDLAKINAAVVQKAW